MQMFEDAITRWRHSRTCKGSAKINREKDLNGQVIQLYVKPDKVSYQHNNIPGKNTVNYTPHIKKNSAELKCMICRERFLSLDDIREHVKYPCRRSYDKSQNLSESENIGSDFDDIEDPTLIKIRRVERSQQNEPVATTGTGLSVLAEASKHIESLLSYNNQLQNNIDRQLRESKLQEISVIPEVSAFNLSKEIKEELEEPVNSDNSIEIKYPVEVLKPKALEPVVILFQQEDGQFIPVDLLDPETVKSYISETAATLPAGQIIQVQLGENQVQSYLKTPGGEILPVEVLATTKQNSVVEYKQEKQESCDKASQVIVEQVEITSSPHPRILQRLPSLQNPKISDPNSVLHSTKNPTLSSLLKLLDTRANTVIPAAQNPVPGLQTLEVLNLEYVEQASAPSAGVSADFREREPVLEEIVEEQGYILPSEQQPIL